MMQTIDIQNYYRGGIMTVVSNVKKTLASLKGARGTLRFYAYQSQEDIAKSVYLDALMEVESVIEDLDMRVKELEFEEIQYKSK